MNLAPSSWLIRAELKWFRLWLVLGVGMIAAVFYLSLTPGDIPGEHYDKILHAATYATMMAWFIQLFRGARSYLLLALGFVAMGAFIEVLQGFHPMRYFDVLDMLANAAGVLLVWALSGTRLRECLRWVERRFVQTAV